MFYHILYSLYNDIPCARNMYKQCYPPVENSRKKILLHARHFAVALEKTRLRRNALNISFQLLSSALTSETSILTMVASVPVYSPATSLVGKYVGCGDIGNYRRTNHFEFPDVR